VRLVAGLSAVLLMPALAACGSKVAPDGTALAPVPTATHSAAPAVTNATDLSKAPVIAPGQGKPPNELVVQDLVVGTGATASSSSTVSVHYVGALWNNGKTFDSSRANGNGQPLIFPLDQVIPGFAQGIDGMKVGGRRELVIPPALGYGPQGGSPPLIAADDTLVFVIDLVDVQTTAGGAAGSRP
jgi:peptidylprolyl isomerase